MKCLTEKVISFLLAVAMVLVLLPTQALAASTVHAVRSDGEEDWVPETSLGEAESAEQFPDILIIEDEPFLEDEGDLPPDCYGG